MDSEYICSNIWDTCHISKASYTHLWPTHLVLGPGRFLTLLRFFSSITSASIFITFALLGSQGVEALLHWPHKSIGTEVSTCISHHTTA